MSARAGLLKLLLAGLLAAASPARAADPLPALGADAKAVTVSGVSSGGYLAVQFHVAHSAEVKGAGVIAGGPYYCAQDSVWTAIWNCMDPGIFVPVPALATLRAEAEAQAKANRIDATSNLKGSRAWLFTGSRDATVRSEVVDRLHGFYVSYKAATVIVRDKPAGHAMVTENAGNPNCSATEPPFINDCDYDAAGELLKHLLGALKPPSAAPTGRLVRFDQKAFSGTAAVSMDDGGFVYVPRECETAACRVHVVFHGCRQGASEIGEQFVRDAGYNRWADSNRLIVLYPQAIARYGWSWRDGSYVWNPRGCWDWWGYTGAAYHTREGAQIKAVQAMVERLAAARR